MTAEKIKNAQEYLTVLNNGEVRRIIDIEELLKKHRPQAVIWFLDRLLKEKQKTLKNLVTRDKSSQKVNETIATMFRIHMAIKTLEREAEVKVA